MRCEILPGADRFSIMSSISPKIIAFVIVLDAAVVVDMSRVDDSDIEEEFERRRGDWTLLWCGLYLLLLLTISRDRT